MLGRLGCSGRIRTYILNPVTSIELSDPGLEPGAIGLAQASDGFDAPYPKHPLAAEQYVLGAPVGIEPTSER
jgi:hypothetical protein